jgi:hypothetical protein
VSGKRRTKNRINPPTNAMYNSARRQHKRQPVQREKTMEGASGRERVLSLCGWLGMYSMAGNPIILQKAWARKGATMCPEECGKAVSK